MYYHIYIYLCIYIYIYIGPRDLGPGPGPGPVGRDPGQSHPGQYVRYKHCKGPCRLRLLRIQLGSSPGRHPTTRNTNSKGCWPIVKE